MAELLKFNVPITSFTVDFRGNLTAKINKRNEVRKSMISTLDSSKTNTKLKRCNSFEPKIRSKSHMVEAPNPLPTDLWKHPQSKILINIPNKQEAPTSRLKSLLSSTTNLMRRYTHLGNRVNFTPLSKATKKSNIKYLENQCNLTLQEIEKRDKRKFNLTQQFVKSKENISDFKNSGNLLKKLTHGSVPSSTKKTEGRCLTAVSRSGWDFQQKSRLKLFRTKETDDFVADLINI